MNAARNILPADIVHDRFRIAKYLSDAVDKTRRAENRNMLKQDDPTLWNTKYLWLRSPEKMMKKQKSAFESLTGLEIDTSKGWAFKRISVIFSLTKTQAWQGSFS